MHLIRNTTATYTKSQHHESASCLCHKYLHTAQTVPFISSIKQKYLDWHAAAVALVIVQ